MLLRGAREFIREWGVEWGVAVLGFDKKRVELEAFVLRSA